VVTGEGKAFCAGADLSQLGASREQGLRHIYGGFLRINSSPLVTVAAVNGAAVGAGMNLALACDVRVVGTSARFDTRFLALGIGPGGGHTWWLQRLVGPQAAAAMVLCGQVIDADAAHRLGLAWQVVPDDELLAVATGLATAAASAPGGHLIGIACRRPGNRTGDPGVVHGPAGIRRATGGPAGTHHQQVGAPASRRHQQTGVSSKETPPANRRHQQPGAVRGRSLRLLAGVSPHRAASRPPARHDARPIPRT